MEFLILLGLFISILFSYVVTFSQATLEMGKELSSSESTTGFQDAITPPWYSNFAIVVYLLSLIFIIYVFYKEGFMIGFVGLGLFFVSSVVAKITFMPKADGKHYKSLIVHSMMNRYANFKRENDNMRAMAIGGLLEKAGYSPPEDKNFETS